MTIPSIIPSTHQFIDDLEAVKDEHIGVVDGRPVTVENIIPVIRMSAAKIWTEVNNLLTFSFFHARRPKSHRGSILHTWTASQCFHRPKIRAGYTSRSGGRPGSSSTLHSDLLGRVDRKRGFSESQAEWHVQRMAILRLRTKY